ncbi:TPA: Flp pilus assembly complex ATPase component TadA, partial [Pseudomonas aeruginosa]|nr:Flp pilus assembly complex ATPase component TadA [Pseudomonas aeruginosa]
LDQLLRYAARHNTNDIHLGDQVPVKARVSGTLYTLTERNLTQDELRSMMTSIYDGSGAAVTAVLGGGRIDTAYECPPTDKQDRSRWRVNMTLRYANGGNGFRVVMRQISSDPPPLEKIKMPSDVVDAVMSLQRGLFLMTGPTGSGKSTSLSS